MEKKKIVIKFVVNRWRKSKRKTSEPVTRSEYANYLFNVGAGWKK